MPELPEVETIRRALEPLLVGRKILSVETRTNTLRSPLDEAALNAALAGQTIKSLRRRAKYLLFDLSTTTCLLSHLGMTGSFRIADIGAELLTHDRVVFVLDNNEELIYNDIRKFGELSLVTIAEEGGYPERLASYAPEPLGKDFTPRYLLRTLQQIKAPIKVAIMRQELVVGVGNIYASEALFAAKINPLRPAQSVSKVEISRLVKEIKKVLTRSLELGGTTISDYKKPDGSEGKFALKLNVYGRAGEKCKRRGCSGTIEKIVQTGRSTFFCAACQF